MSPAPAKQPVVIETALAEHRAFVRERLRGLGVASVDLDDATQDVFEVLVRRIADYDPSRPIRAWMAGIARKVARRYRDRGRRAVLPLDERRPDPEPSPEDRAARAEAWEVLQRFLDELEPERWSVFVLSEIEGLRGSEIAAELGVNQNTVYARLRSARIEFERVLRRHRARERRGVWAILPWDGSHGSRHWVLPAAVIGSVSLGAGVIAAGHCGVDETTFEQVQARADAGSADVTAAPRDSATQRSLTAKDTTSDPDPEIWISAGAGFSIGSNAKGERYTLSVEKRYRLDGDRVILELTYIGDDDVEVDAANHRLVPDGLEVIDGDLEWTVAVPAGELRVVVTTLRATREGVVRLWAESVHTSGGVGRTGFAWVNEAGLLRRCDEGECDFLPATGKERLSGKRITVHVHNQCTVIKEFVLFAGYPEITPDESAQVYSLQPDEQRTMEIDAAQWFLHRRPDGRVSGGGSVDSDGGRIRFFGRGEECNGIQGWEADAPEPPSLGPW